MGSQPLKYLLDTNVWIWCHNAPERLSPMVRKSIENPKDDDELLLSVISPWELFKLVEKRRLTLSSDAFDWVETALQRVPLRMIELSPRISHQSTVLPDSLNGDPADQIIVATARIERAVILTKDKQILNYPHVRSMW